MISNYLHKLTDQEQKPNYILPANCHILYTRPSRHVFYTQPAISTGE